MSKRGRTVQFALDPDEAGRLWAYCKGLDVADRFLIGAQLWCGMRAGEVVHARRDWLRDDCLVLPEFQDCRCSDCAGRGHWKPKSRAGARTIPVPGVFIADVRVFLERNPGGLSYGRCNVNQRTKGILCKAGIVRPALSRNTAFPHAVRATYLNTLVANGIDTIWLAYVAGWADLNVARHYISLVRAKDVAIQEVRRILG